MILTMLILNQRLEGFASKSAISFTLPCCLLFQRERHNPALGRCITLNQVKDMRYVRIMSNVDVDRTDGCIPKWTEAISCLPRMTFWIHMLMF